MGKRLPHTPSSKIRSALRRLWLQSRERSAALKEAEYRCACCGVKQSRRKGAECQLDVHHVDGVEWHEVIELIRRYLLVDPSRLQPLCTKCHDNLHENDKAIHKVMPEHSAERHRKPEIERFSERHSTGRGRH